MVASSISITDESIWLAYLTYVEIPSLGTVGGLLLVDRRARPLEFHCSAPVLPTRTQEILYGKTLRSALHCDQIGKSLLEQTDRQASLIVTNDVTAMGLRPYVESPMALFVEDEAQLSDQAETDAENWAFEINDYVFTAAAGARDDRELIREILRSTSGTWDLMEPIERIQEAVREAHRAAA